MQFFQVSYVLLQVLQSQIPQLHASLYKKRVMCISVNEAGARVPMLTRYLHLCR